MAAACAQGCPWGELGDFVKEAMKPLGYEVLLCRNCNFDRGTRLVSTAGYPPELGLAEIVVGTTERPNGPLDFGVTESGFLAWAYRGLYNYADGGPYSNLRLIAKIEDPMYLLAAVKRGSGITDLAQIAERRLPVKIIGGDTPTSAPVLAHYGITREAVESWGGSMESAVVASFFEVTDFDLIVSELASPANNPESSLWTLLSRTFDLRFLDLPEELLDRLANTPELGLERVTAKWGLLRGVDRAIPTVARSGEAVFARSDTPDQAAYDVARAIDAHRGALKWYIRPYSYDPNTVWKNLDVPLHPGAERYYREVGYLARGGPAETLDSGAPPPLDGGAICTAEPGSESSGTSHSSATAARGLAHPAARSDGSCALHASGAAADARLPWLLVATALGLAGRRARRRRA
jgi:TRAP-type uncharacterized transport system substrate-binding protein